MSAEAYQVPNHWAEFEGAHHQDYGNELKRARCLCSVVDNQLPWRAGIAVLGEPLLVLPQNHPKMRLLIINTAVPTSFLKLLIKEAACNTIRMKIRITAKAMKGMS
jgi:hypothetical protein